MEYYSGFNKKEILSHVTAWMNLEDILLGERPGTEGRRMIPALGGSYSSPADGDGVGWCVAGAGQGRAAGS